jgi:hypothetical protein
MSSSGCIMGRRAPRRTSYGRTGRVLRQARQRELGSLETSAARCDAASNEENQLIAALQRAASGGMVHAL